MPPHTTSSIQSKITIHQKEQEKPAIRDIAWSRNDPVEWNCQVGLYKLLLQLKDLVQKWTTRVNREFQSRDVHYIKKKKKSQTMINDSTWKWVEIIKTK